MILHAPFTDEGCTREAWLVEVRDRLRPWYEKEGIDLPNARISVGFPYSRPRSRGSNHAIGQCWERRASRDGTPEIFYLTDAG
jgi:hypothetical protein